MDENENVIRTSDPELGRAEAIDRLRRAKAYIVVPIIEGEDPCATMGGDAAHIPNLMIMMAGTMKLLCDKNLEQHQGHLTMLNLVKEEMEEMLKKKNPPNREEG